MSWTCSAAEEKEGKKEGEKKEGKSGSKESRLLVTGEAHVCRWRKRDVITPEPLPRTGE